MYRKLLHMISILLLLLNAAGALSAGSSMILEPDGTGLQLPLIWLQHTPFNDFLIPGIILFLVNGVFNIWVIIMILLKKPRYPHYIMLAGILLVGWILVQVVMTRMNHILQFIFGTIGVLMFITGLLLKAAEESTKYKMRNMI